MTKKKLMNEIDNLNRKVEIEKSNREFYKNQYYKLLDENTDLKNKITNLESKIEDLDKKIEIYDSYPSPLLSEEDKVKMYCDLKIAELEKKYSWLVSVITLQSSVQSYNYNTYQQLVNSGMYQRTLTF